MTDFYLYLVLGSLFISQVACFLFLLKGIHYEAEKSELRDESLQKKVDAVSTECEDLPAYKDLLSDFQRIETEWITTRESFNKLANRLTARKAHIARGHDLENVDPAELAAAQAPQPAQSRAERRRQIEVERLGKGNSGS